MSNDANPWETVEFPEHLKVVVNYQEVYPPAAILQTNGDDWRVVLTDHEPATHVVIGYLTKTEL